MYGYTEYLWQCNLLYKEGRSRERNIYRQIEECRNQRDHQ